MVPKVNPEAPRCAPRPAPPLPPAAPPDHAMLADSQDNDTGSRILIRRDAFRQTNRAFLHWSVLIKSFYQSTSDITRNTALRRARSSCGLSAARPAPPPGRPPAGNRRQNTESFPANDDTAG
ncbi:hypothetical protein EVAR_74620_1 [Eumeta japonica]|uniref:Uncharacterized protein n=1 Tax=Eumeta variegata TaxID=151549 RepID=A0A4C1WDB7_EUMVA|nr:hypothetical protein EVAR_74620_1 [Eumeta japonica]